MCLSFVNTEQFTFICESGKNFVFSFQLKIMYILNMPNTKNQIQQFHLTLALTNDSYINLAKSKTQQSTEEIRYNIYINNNICAISNLFPI